MSIVKVREDVALLREKRDMAILRPHKDVILLKKSGNICMQRLYKNNVTLLKKKSFMSIL